MFDDVIAQLEARVKRFGPMRDANAYATVHGECGDITEVWLRIDGGRIRKGSYMTSGCGWSKLCCDTAVRLSEGMSIEQALALSQAQVLEATGPLPEDHRHCALLAADTVHQAVEQYKTEPPKTTVAEKAKRLFKR